MTRTEESQAVPLRMVNILPLNMQLTDGIHCLELPFKVPVGPGVTADRTVYVYVILGESVALVDAGVAGSETKIFEYLGSIGSSPRKVTKLILSHSHPDHIGAARAIHDATGCEILAHAAEKDWIEDAPRQSRERPVPGFDVLVRGRIGVSKFLEDGDILALGDSLSPRVIHTPGHSRGSISLYFKDQKTIFTGDAILLPNDLPMYEDVLDSVSSITRLSRFEDVELLVSSWAAPVRGHDRILRQMDQSIRYLERIHETTLRARSRNVGTENPMELCRQVMNDLGLPAFSVNPIAAKAFASSLAHEDMTFNKIFAE